jgi:hypothetical protein
MGIGYEECSSYIIPHPLAQEMRESLFDFSVYFRLDMNERIRIEEEEALA